MQSLRAAGLERWSWGYSTFSPAEAVAVTGIPPTLLRVWRNRGQLPGGRGRSAKFTARDLAEILIRYQLSTAGVAPSESSAIGQQAAQLVLLFAILNHDGACEVGGSPEETAEFLKMLADGERIALAITDNPSLAGFIWRGDGGALSLMSDVRAAMEERAFVSNYFLDLEAAASRLVARSARPLIIVEGEMKASQRRVRRLSIGR